MAASVARVASAETADVERAKALYQAAEREIAVGQYVDAARDYGAAYGITKDPVLFFKIGSADEKAGRCDVAVVYYRRYLKEASPAPKFVELTKERIKACGGRVPSAAEAATAAADTDAGTAEGSPSPSPSPSKSKVAARDPHAAAWLVAGGAIALAIGGSVLAYAATSSENDISDLYVGLQNMTPTYDATTQKRYQDLLDEGHRYQHLSWASFGASAVASGVSALLFTRQF